MVGTSMTSPVLSQRHADRRAGFVGDRRRLRECGGLHFDCNRILRGSDNTIADEAQSLRIDQLIDLDASKKLRRRTLMGRKAMTMILTAMLLGGAATIPTMALARGGGGGGHFERGGHFGGGYYGGHYGGIRGHYYGWGGYWGDAYTSCYPYLGTPYCY
jgi:hypothetical protein